MALRYLTDTDEAVSLQPEPLGSVTSAKLTTACDMAEDEVDRYLANQGIATPITLASLDQTQKDLLKRATAKMVEFVLFDQHGPKAAVDKAKAEAEQKMDEFIDHADLSHTTVQTRLGIANWQREYQDDAENPNQTIENMDE